MVLHSQSDPRKSPDWPEYEKYRASEYMKRRSPLPFREWQQFKTRDAAEKAQTDAKNVRDTPSWLRNGGRHG